MKDHSFHFQIDRFMQQLQAAGYAESSRSEIARMLKYFRAYARARGRANDVRDVDRQLIADYRKHVLSLKKYSLDYRAGMLIDVRSFFRWLSGEGLILGDPTSTLTLPKMSGRTLPPYLSQEEVKRLIEAAQTDCPRGLRDRAILETLYSTGMRQAELRRLAIADINFADGLVRVIQGKGSKDRMVPIGSVALRWIDRYMKEVRGPGAGGPLFRNLETTHPLTSNQIKGILERAKEKAGIKTRIYPHLLRHTFGVHMLEGGADIRLIQAMMGHEHLCTTQIYTLVVPFQLRKAHAESHPAEKRREKLPENLQPTRRFHHGWMQSQ